jgi:histidine triad (HIT) family protein
MKKALKPLGVACLQLNGKGVNQVVLHYHLHLIPRVAHTPELPMTSWELKPGDPEAIKQTVQKIREKLE